MKYVAAILIALMINLPVYAVEVDLKCVPAGKLLKVGDDTYRAYTFEEWKQVLVCDQELGMLREQKALYAGLSEDLRLKLKLWDQIDTQNTRIIDIYSSENERIFQKWAKTDKELQEMKAADRSFIHYAIEGALVLTVGVLSTILIVRR